MSETLRLTIPEPCHENWQHMTPAEQGRYCMSCRKTVIDFSVMSDREILKAIAEKNSSICGRFSDDQLNRDIREPAKRKHRSLLYFYNLLVASFLIAGQVRAQGKVKVGRVLQVNRPVIPQHGFIKGDTIIQCSPDITGRVLDQETGEPVRASVMIKGTSMGVATDAAGTYTIANTGIMDTAVLEISAMGYETTAVTLGKRDTVAKDIFLKRDVQVLEGVTVTGYATKRLKGMLGVLYISRTATTISKINRSWNEWKSKREVKLYPNPVQRGQVVNISLSIKEKGAYRLEIWNAAGSLIQVKPVTIADKEVNFMIATQASWSAGNYYIRIISGQTRKRYEAKFVML